MSTTSAARKSRLYEQILVLRMDVNEPWDPTAIAYRHGRNDVIKDVLRLLDEHRISGKSRMTAEELDDAQRWVDTNGP